MTGSPSTILSRTTELLATRNGLFLPPRVPFLRRPTSRAGFRGSSASRPWKDSASEANGADGGNRGPEGRGLDRGHFRRICVSQMDGVLKIGSAPPSQTNPEIKLVQGRRDLARRCTGSSHLLLTGRTARGFSRVSSTPSVSWRITRRSPSRNAYSTLSRLISTSSSWPR